MKTLPYTRNLLLGLIILYYSQGALFESGTSFTQLTLLLILGISGIFFVKILLLRKITPLVKAWTALVLINLLSFFFTANFLSETGHIDYLKAILLTLLPFYPFYYFALKGHLKVKHFLIFFIIMLPVSILQFNIEKVEMLTTSISGSVVNNSAYLFVGLIPFVFLIKKRLYAYLSIAVISYFIIMGAKRGALVVGVLGLVMYVYYQIRTIPKKNKFKAYALVFVGFIALSVFTVKTYSQNVFLQTRFQQAEAGSWSGRENIYANIFTEWLNSDSIIQIIFGYGFMGSMKLSGTGNVAHNDWLELLANNGIIGILIYLVLFYYGFKSCFNPYWDRNKQLVLLTIMLIWFATTLFSMGFTSSSFTGMFLMIAYLIGDKTGKLS